MKPTFSLALTLLAAPLLTAAPLPDALLQEAEQAVRQVHARADAGLWDTQRAIRADATLLRIRLAKARADGDQAAAKTHAQALRDTLQAAARHAILAEPPARAEADAWLAEALAL